MPSLHSPKVVLAPSSFKGSLSPRAAAQAMGKGVLAACPRAAIIEAPLSDGGEGLVDVLEFPMRLTVRETEVQGPLPGQRVKARWGSSSDHSVAVIEMASAAGMALVPESRRDPNVTTTYGVGELIREAVKGGATTVYLGLGGSATIDGGAGMAEALGLRFSDANGDPIVRGARGLPSLVSIERMPDALDLSTLAVHALCDVTNRLTGPNGAALVYGPQKGARREELSLLDQGLCHFARVVERDCGISIESLEGGGAAGGMGAAVAGCLRGSLEQGIARVLDLTDFRRRVEDADLIITGEGRLDVQTGYGKVIAGVTRCAREAGIPVAAIAGSVEGDRDEIMRSYGFRDLRTLVGRGISPSMALKDAEALLVQRAAELTAGIFPHDR